MNFNQLLHKIKNWNVVEKYIYTIIGVFILTYGVQSLSVLAGNSKENFFISNFGLQAGWSFLKYHFYSFFTYSFIHIRFFHLLFNLMVLYYIGNLFLSFFKEKDFHIYFFFGAFFGGVFFVLANYFLLDNGNSILIGASASITALLVGLAVKAPNYQIHIRFVGYVKIWILTLIWLAISFVSIPTANAGGQIAHLGGAFFGLVYTLLQESSFSFKQNKSHLKTVYKKSDFGLSKHQKDRLHQQKVDFLLDKISKSGYNSLSKAEREFLARASKR